MSWISSTDPILRLVAAEQIGIAGVDVERITGLASDADQTTRVEVLRGVSSGLLDASFDELLDVATSGPHPEHRTCTWCGSVESAATFDCTGCDNGRRDPLPEALRQLKADIEKRPS